MTSPRAGLLGRSAAADQDAAFTAWVRAHRPQLMRTAYLLSGDRFVAEDLVQTCLTRLYLAWPRVSTLEAPLAYARRALVNAHIDLTRRPWWSRERLAPDASPGASAVVSDGSAAVDVRDAVVTALLSLPAGQRRVVVLRYLCGLSVRETASELAIAEGTVKSQTSEALRSLAVVLAAVDRAEG
ncbi:MAG TPA: SigE family RNA polymerase sigma factor [Lapillicoccus sp.]|nr:SigE family RNA polymerase sigma factor [Lapillicoccus sp.]